MNKKVFIAIAVIFLVAGALALAGCGSSSAITQDGVPVYPGATKVNPASLRDNQPRGSMPEGMRGSFPGGSFPGGSFPGGSFPGPDGSSPYRMRGSMPGALPGNMSAYWTKDTFDKVSGWYRKQLSGKSGFREISPQARGQNAPNGSAPAGNMQRRLGNRAIFTFKSGDSSKIVTVAEYNQPGGGSTIRIGGMQGTIPGPPIRQY